MKSTARIGIGIIIFAAFATITWIISNNGLQAQPLNSIGEQNAVPASQTDNGFLTGPAEGSPVSIATAYLTGNRNVMGLTQTDLGETAVTETYTKQSDFTQVEFSQQLNGIGVYNGTILVNVAGDGSIINMHNQFVPDLSNKTNATAPVLTAEEAINAAAGHLGLTTVNLTVEGSSKNAAEETIFNDGGISRNSIPAKLLYYPTGKDIRLAWDIEIYMRNEDNWWSMRVDAITGEILDQFNYVIHEDFLEQAQLSHGDAYLDGVQYTLPGSFSFPPSSAMLADTYRVYEWPVESPNHSASPNPTDGRTLSANPSAAASADASPFGWHDDNTTTYTTTQGNNVDAQKGGTESNCGATLDCDHALDLTVDPTVGSNVDAAIDNLFYWNNITHDVWYNYGFDEVNRNFQEDNNGQGGAGGDSVTANAQASGNCNANFSTPTDGGNPTMNMYTCDIATPTRDGDLDNGVVVHEYTHGISIRLTGGTSVSCLSNSEQMGEGWSDWYGLMMTIEAGDAGADARGIGTWLLGEAVDGQGVRTQRYSTDMTVNTHTYGDLPGMAVPHGVGEVWATMIWDVTWALIADGSSSGHDMDIYNGTGGNNLAMQLVTDGMKLQPCSPGFVDGRDAILLADQNLTGGANQCVIWEAFARRGLGFSADQGLSSSSTDGTEAFDIPDSCNFINPQPPTQNVCVGTDAVYDIDVNAGFVAPVTMSTAGEPAGSAVAFSVNPVAGPLPQTTSMTVSSIGVPAVGSHTITITGTDSSGSPVSESATVDLTVFPNTLTSPTPVSPADTATSQSNSPTLSWSSVAGASDYLVEVSDDSLFSTIVYSATASGTSHDVVMSLNALSTYYWRVTTQNMCTTSSASTVFSFTTANIVCASYPSADVPLLIPESGTSGATNSIVTVANLGTIVDVNVLNLVGTHTWMDDLDFNLSSPLGTNVQFRDRACNSDDDFDINYDDDATPGAAPCPPTDGGTYQPSSPLSAFNNEDIVGDWTLTINDNAIGDTGQLDSWSLELCVIPGAAAAIIDVTPGSMSSTQAPDSVVTQTLNIDNIGNADLIWTAVEDSGNDCDLPTDIGWVTGLTPSGGTTVSNTNSIVNFNFDSTGLAAAVYTGTLCINNNDLTNSLVEVPLTLTVSDPPPPSTNYCSAPGVSIPDNNPAGVNDTISVAPGGNIVDMNVAITATHTWVGDLIFTLTHVDSGTSVTLIDRPGVPAGTFGCNNNDLTGIADDSGNIADIENHCAGTTPWINDSFVPMEPLAGFNGEDLSGEWTLNVSDNVGADTGTLAEWCLQPTIGIAPPTPPQIEVNPTQLSSLQVADTTVDQTLTISNSGELTLTWTIQEEPALSSAMPFLSLPTATHGNEPTIDANGVANLEKNLEADVSLHPATGAVNFIRFDEGQQFNQTDTSLAAQVDELFAQYGSVFGIRDASTELVLVSTEKDAYGFTHLTYHQVVGGIPVFGGDIRVHATAANEITAVNGVFIPDLAMSTQPSLTADEASRFAVAEVLAQPYSDSDEMVAGVTPANLTVEHADLYFFRANLLEGIPGLNYLVYEVEIRSGTNLREFLYLDAHTGKVVERYSAIHDALFRRLYENNTGNEIWTEGDGFPGALDQWQQNEIMAAGHTYNFFENAFGYTSYDNADAEMRTVNNDPTISCPNANWNGNTANYCTGTAADDVVAHEWGHAYTEYTSGLIYGWQTGALNESYSDVWGETVDLLNLYEDDDDDNSLRTACSSSDRWRMGEDASAFGGAIRDMWNPTCDGDPGKVTDAQYHCVSSDSGGVHINSGVPNHLYALLVDGGTYNGQTVTSIGFTKAAHILWRAQSVYETNTTDFAAHADALEASCSDLLGQNLEGLSTTGTPAGPSGEIISVADCQEVADAILAVELRTPPACGFVPMFDPNAPALCGPGSAEATIFSEDFESGLGAWIVSQVPVNPGTWDARDWEVISTLPDGHPGNAVYGVDAVVGDCQADLDNGIMRLDSPVINIPGGANTPVRMAFDQYVSMEDLWDGGNLKISINGGGFVLVPNGAFTFNGYSGTLTTAGAGNDNPMAGQVAFTGANGGSVAGSWGQSQLDLSSLGVNPGDTIVLRWELGSDGCNGWDGWYVDDVEVYSCALLCTAPADVAWLSLSSTNDSTDPMSATPITVTFDSAGLPSGNYNANLCISSNDPVTPLVTVPVTMTVNLGPYTLDGTVTLDGVPAPDGTVVTILTNGTAVTTAQVISGQYQAAIPSDNIATAQVDGGIDGDVITFAVDRYEIKETDVWQAGGSGTLDLTNGTFVYNESGAIDGNTNVTFYAHDNNPSLIFNANGNDLGATTIEVRANQDCTTVADETVTRCFNISPLNNTGRNATITFTFYESQIPAGQTCAAMNVYHHDGTNWSSPLTLDNLDCASSPHTIRVTGVTDFSPFVIKGDGSPTAVSLQSFSATGNNGGLTAVLIVVSLLFVMMGVSEWRKRRCYNLYD